MNYFEEKIDIYLEQFKELRRYYPKLKDQIDNENLFLRGEVCFNEDFSTGFSINDCYLIEIVFSPSYPNLLPAVKEIGGKIESDYPHINKNGTRTLCLGTNVDLWLRFSKTKTILNFVYNLLVPSLYAHAYWKKKGRMPPWGDRPHGTSGIIQFYSQLFQIMDLYAILRLIGFVVNHNYDGNLTCPCGRRKSLNECHGKMILNLSNSVPREYLIKEYNEIIMGYFKYYKRPIS